ncbi:MAG: adenosylcobinamide amidohydrolase [Pseudomonadota bacterium]
MNAPHITLDRPWLVFDLGAPMRVLSWALNRPGFVTSQRIIWREVRNADLPRGFDVRHWLKVELMERGETQSVALLTSRNIERFQTAEAKVGDAVCSVLATVGLSNAERIGGREPVNTADYGTINVAVKLENGLTQSGLIEALSIATQARTTAVLDAKIAVSSGAATGTGTDCIAIAAPFGDTDFTGLHTEVGEAVGRSVYDAVHQGTLEWKKEQGRGTYA